jgi:hypothetical protein
MFCSGCGQALTPGQVVCPQCGRPVAPPIPPVPNLEFQLQNYDGRIKALSIVWFVYGGLSLVLGILGLAFANAFFHGNFGPWAHGPWEHGPWGPETFWPAILHFGWAIVVVRSALALAAGWGLMERTAWGRIVAIVAAFLFLLKIPIGTALGIWTLVTLLGYRNSSLYDQLPQARTW